MLHDILVAIRSDADIVSARQQGRSLASSVGFTATDAGMALMAFLMEHSLLPPATPVARPRAHKSKLARKKRRKEARDAAGRAE